MLRVWLFGVVRLQVDDGPELTIDERAQRLIAWLVLAPGDRERRSRQRIVSDLWPGRGDHNLRQALRQLRERLGEEGRARHLLEGRGLVGLTGEVWADVWEFDRLQRTDPEAAVALASDRLLDSVQRSPGAWDEQRRREWGEKLVETLGQGASARAANGDRPGAVALARRRLELSPASDAAAADLMRHLAAAGERSEAISVYRNARATRRPGPEMVRARRDIDQAEEPPSDEPAHPGPQSTRVDDTADMGSKRRMAPLAIAALAVAVVVAVGAFAASRQPPAEEARASCGPSMTTPSPADDAAGSQPSNGETAAREAVDRIAVGTRPASVAIASEGVWVASRQGVALVDPTHARQVGGSIGVGGGTPDNAPYAIAVAEDRLWVTRRDGYLESIDRETREVVGKPIRYGDQAGEVAVGGGGVWVNNFDDAHAGMVSRIDPCSGSISRLKVGREASSVRFGYGSLWVTDAADGLVARIDPQSGRRIATISGFDDPQDIGIGGGGVWVTQYGPQLVRRIDPARNRAVGRNIEVGPDPAGVAIGKRSLWVPLYGNGTLTEVDLATQKRRRPSRRVGQSPTDAAYGFGHVWVPDNNGDSIARVPARE